MDETTPMLRSRDRTLPNINKNKSNEVIAFDVTLTHSLNSRFRRVSPIHYEIKNFVRMVRQNNLTLK